MDVTISAAEANRGFSRLLRGVREGRSYMVTAHGRAVARVVPADGDERQRAPPSAQRRSASPDRTRTHQSAVEIGPWTRDELYER